MRGVVLGVLGLTVIAGGIFLGYPPYVESRILADLERHNREHPAQQISVKDLSVDPWTSAVFASEVAVESAPYAFTATNVRVTTDSAFFLTPVRTVTTATFANGIARDSNSDSSFRFADGSASDLSLPVMPPIDTKAFTKDPFRSLALFSFASLEFAQGAFALAGEEQYTFERIALSDLRDERLGAFLIAGFKPAGSETDMAAFEKLLIRDMDLIDLEGFDDADGVLWTPVSSADGRGQTLEIGFLEIEGAHVEPDGGKTENVTLDRLTMTGLAYAPGTASDPEPVDVIEALVFQSILAEGMAVAGAEDVDIRIGRLSISGFDKGAVAGIELGGFDVSGAQGKMRMGSFVTDGINLSGILRAAAANDRGDKALTPWLRAWNFGGFDIKDMSFEAAEGDASSFGAVSLRGLDYYKGLPVAATLTVTDSHQSISKENIEKELEKIIGPVVLDFPTESLSSGDVVYRMDMETGVLTVTSQSLDRKHGLRSLLDLRLSGLAPVFMAAATGDPALKDHLPGIALEKIVVEIDSGQAWPTPEPIGGVPTTRMFLMQLLAQASAEAQGRQDILLAPAHSFLERGGLFRIALEPPQAFPVLQMQILPMLPPEQAIGLIGLTAVHE